MPPGRAELEPHPTMSQCYTSRLLVEGVDQGDSGKYVVRAENERGMDMVTVQLLVQGEGSLAVVSVSLMSQLFRLPVHGFCNWCDNQPAGGVPHHCGDHHHFLQSTQIVLQR